MTFSTPSRQGPKVGLLVPFTNVNFEPDMAMMCPEGATLHATRLGGYDRDEIPGSDQMAGLGAAQIDQELDLIAGIRPDIILYGCTSATLTHGTSFDDTLAKRIATRSGAKSITAAGALVQAIHTLNLEKIGFASPYLGEVNTQAIAFLESNRIETVQVSEVGHALDNYGQGELTPKEVFDLALQADHPDAQGIVLSCTDMRSAEVVDDVEKALGKPVVTSNQALMFATCRILGLPSPKISPGELFSKLA